MDVWSRGAFQACALNHSATCPITTARSDQREAITTRPHASRFSLLAGSSTDRVGFEPTIPLPVYRFSRPAPSATRTPVQIEPSIVVAARYVVNANTALICRDLSRNLASVQLQHARLHPQRRQRELERRRALIHRGRNSQ